MKNGVYLDLEVKVLGCITGMLKSGKLLKTKNTGLLFNLMELYFDKYNVGLNSNVFRRPAIEDALFIVAKITNKRTVEESKDKIRHFRKPFNYFVDMIKAELKSVMKDDNVEFYRENNRNFLNIVKNH